MGGRAHPGARNLGGGGSASALNVPSAHPSPTSPATPVATGPWHPSLQLCSWPLSVVPTSIVWFKVDPQDQPSVLSPIACPVLRVPNLSCCADSEDRWQTWAGVLWQVPPSTPSTLLHEPKSPCYEARPGRSRVVGHGCCTMGSTDPSPGSDAHLPQPCPLPHETPSQASRGGGVPRDLQLPSSLWPSTLPGKATAA